MNRLLLVFALCIVAIVAAFPAPAAAGCGGVAVQSFGGCGPVVQSFGYGGFQPAFVQPFAFQSFASPVFVNNVGHHANFNRVNVFSRGNNRAVQVNVGGGANVRVRTGIFGNTRVLVR